MELREKLELKDARIVQICKYPKDPEPSRVLVIEAALTPSVADVLKCRSIAFNINDLPNKFEGGFGLGHELVEVEVKLAGSKGGMVSLFPKVVKKFRVGHDEKDDLTITLRCHFSGYGATLDEWSDDVNNKEFVFQMLSMQGNLFDPPATGDGVAGGKRVDMSGDKKASSVKADEPELDTGCILCNNRVPFEIEGLHSNGSACTRGGAGAATLASAREAGVGTHQKGRKPRTAPVPEPATDAVSDPVH